MKYLNTEIRDATMEDLPKLLELENLCFIHPWKEKDLIYELTENPVCNFFVIEVSNEAAGLKEICGFVNYWNTFDSGTLCQICVHPDVQRLGFGMEMMREVIKDAYAKKVRTITLEVRKSNEKAISFYKKVGFEVSHIKPSYYVDGEDAVYMILEVNKVYGNNSRN